MLDYAVKLSRTPSAVTSDDVERLRGAGFEDAAVLDICGGEINLAEKPCLPEVLMPGEPARHPDDIGNGRLPLLDGIPAGIPDFPD